MGHWPIESSNLSLSATSSRFESSAPGCHKRMSEQPDLPDRLKHEGLSLWPYGVHEWAVPLASALDLVSEIVKDDRVVLGGDFWHVRGNRLELASEPWALRWRKRHEPWRGFVEESSRVAEAAIQSRLVYFNDVAEPVFVAIQSRDEVGYGLLATPWHE